MFPASARKAPKNTAWIPSCAEFADESNELTGLTLKDYLFAERLGKPKVFGLEYSVADAVPETYGRPSDGRVHVAKLDVQAQASRSDWLVFNQRVPSVLQHGPMCGLVAVSMAGAYLASADGPESAKHDVLSDAVQQLSTDDRPAEIDANTWRIYKQARRMGVSCFGEMFSAKAMADVVRMSTALTAELVSELTAAGTVKALLRGGLVLFPYDTDRKQGAPDLNKGHKAHWAVLTGFAMESALSDPSGECIAELDRRPSTESTIDVAWDQARDTLAISFQDQPVFVGKASSLHLFARHGKTRYQSLWAWEKLLASNANLVEPDPERLEEKSSVIPKHLLATLGEWPPGFVVGRTLEALQGKAVVVQK